jgi:nicotinate phosphoribosyltransferase
MSGGLPLTISAGTATFNPFSRRFPAGRGSSLPPVWLTPWNSVKASASPRTRSTTSATVGLDDAALAALRDMTFTGDVWAVPEGRVVFADEPLLEITAPIAQA